MPGVEDETVRVDAAVPREARVTLAGFREAVRPGEETDADNATVPLNLLILVTVIVDVADEPEAKVRAEGLGDMRKSFAPFVMLQLSVYVPTTGTN